MFNRDINKKVYVAFLNEDNELFIVVSNEKKEKVYKCDDDYIIDYLRSLEL